MDCAQCGASLPEGSRFCNECGAPIASEPVEVASAPAEPCGPAADPDSTAHADPPARKKTSPALILTLVALILLILVGGFFGIASYQRAQERSRAQAAAEAKAFKAARSEASRVLAKIEQCESAVTVGVTLDDLSTKSADAREAALAFSRSEHAELLPEFSTAALDAAQDYVDSCARWFEDNEQAKEKWDKAFAKWDVLSDKSAPEIEDFKDDTETQAAWSKATEDLTRAREALKSATL